MAKAVPVQVRGPGECLLGEMDVLDLIRGTAFFPAWARLRFARVSALFAGASTKKQAAHSTFGPSLDRSNFFRDEVPIFSETPQCDEEPLFRRPFCS